MYPDLSVTGRLFGGKVLSWLDEALAMFAFKHMRSHDVVTRHISEVNFETPGLLGDMLEIYARADREGRTSLTVEGLVISRRQREGQESLHLINSCEIVFVTEFIDGHAVNQFHNKVGTLALCFPSVDDFGHIWVIH